jgi:hypothetical protein
LRADPNGSKDYDITVQMAKAEGPEDDNLFCMAIAFYAYELTFP